MNNSCSFISRALAFALCLSGSATIFAADKEAVEPEIVAQYAKMVHASYEDSLSAAQKMQSAIHKLVDQPSEAHLDAARKAWVVARQPYLQTEVYRFYDGPIDDPKGPEGLINAWPMDEAYVDYVVDQPLTGFINQPDRMPEISMETIETVNEKDGETNISSGWHAIEFLLWGQDLDPDGPGKRPYTDFVVFEKGPGVFAKRRGQYLLAVTDLLIKHLNFLVDAWAPAKPGNYRASFEALPPKEAIGKILNGMGMLSGFELAGERMSVPVETQAQEDEHSCFSDTTHQDIALNMLGIANIYRGKYKRTDGSIVSGPGIKDLPDAETLAPQMDKALALCEAIEAPFDKALLQSEGGAQRAKIEAAIEALHKLGDQIAAFAGSLGIKITIGSPE